jgi:mannose/fructose/N-acetylgalactosamine-specific phosphotransferase system component IIB
VDDRLLHGQVTVAWRQHLLPDEIWIVDDLVRADPFLADVLCMAAPAGVTIHIYSVPEAISAWAAHLSPASADPPSTHTYATPPGRSLGPCARPSNLPSSSLSTFHPPCLLLVKTPQVALALAQGGLPFSHLNVGNISPGPGSRRVFRTISLAPEHIAALDALAQRGVSITFQLTPEDSQVDWQTIRRQHPDF